MNPAVENYLKKFDKLPVKDKKDTGEKTMTFGKHFGLPYKWIYENDTSYCSWVISDKNKDSKYFQSLRSYILDRIEREYNDGKLDAIIYEKEKEKEDELKT